MGAPARPRRQLGVAENQIVKTLLMQDERGHELVILMHGDCSVSTRNLARSIGVKTVSPCSPEQAQRVTGYRVGGISPFGSRKRLPVYVERTVLGLPRLLDQRRPAWLSARDRTGGADKAARRDSCRVRAEGRLASARAMTAEAERAHARRTRTNRGENGS